MIYGFDDIYFAIYGRPFTTNSYWELAGLLIGLKPVSAQRKNQNLFSLISLYQEAIATRQVDFFFDNQGNPVGYLIWAYTDGDEDKRSIWFAKQAPAGSDVGAYIIDFYSKTGNLYSILSYLRNKRPLGVTFARYTNSRRNQTRSIRIRCESKNPKNVIKEEEKTKEVCYNYVSLPDVENFIFSDSIERLSNLLGVKKNNISVYNAILKFRMLTHVGRAAHIAYRGKVLSEIGDREFSNLVIPSLEYEQISFKYDMSGEPRAFIVWGYMDDIAIAGDNIASVFNMGRFELNEGRYPCLLLVSGEQKAAIELINEWVRSTCSLDQDVFLHPSIAETEALIRFKGGGNGAARDSIYSV